MFVESYLGSLAYNQDTLTPFQLLLVAAVAALYLYTYGRALFVAFKKQGLLQGLFALFFYPLYLIWNVTTLIRK
jgi:hypothetical protein